MANNDEKLYFDDTVLDDEIPVFNLDNGSNIDATIEMSADEILKLQDRKAKSSRRLLGNRLLPQKNVRKALSRSRNNMLMTLRDRATKQQQSPKPHKSQPQKIKGKPKPKPKVNPKIVGKGKPSGKRGKFQKDGFMLKCKTCRVEFTKSDEPGLFIKCPNCGKIALSFGFEKLY